ncbi:aryl-sulfate sulfotransferase [Halosimplex aquaticum]
MSRSVLRSRTRLGVLRRIAAVAVVVTVALLAYSFVGTAIGDDGRQATGERDRPLVAAIDGTGPGQIVAFGASGEVVHRNRSLWLYHDVDPSPRGSQTVTYVASGPAASRHCARDTCIENVVRRVNLTTGEGTVLHTWKGSLNGSAQFHDVDRIDESTLLVADISFPDRVFAVNTTTDEVVWEWRVSEAYEPSSGGNYPGDWTHVNDVEYLPDGRVMVSLRNQDQVVFIEPGEGCRRTGRSVLTATTASSTRRTTPTTSPPSAAGRPSWSPTARTTGSSSTPAETGRGCARGPGPTAASSGPATPTACRTATPSSSTPTASES